MKKILLVVDVQNDFVDGALGSPEAQKAAKKIVELIADKKWNKVIATVDQHPPKPMLRTIEADTVPLHCIAHSPGAALYTGIAEHVDHIIEKSNFSVDSEDIWPYLQRTSEDAPDTKIPDVELFICGLCTDICVISNALMLRSMFPHIKITVLPDLCAGTTPKKHNAALDVMDSCLINIRYSFEIH